MSGIFISYRREDSAPYAGRLYDRLSKQFGADQVFMDVDDIPAGADFTAEIEAKIVSCDAMIVVIGKHWLTARNGAGQPRVLGPSDFVAREVSLALRRGVLVIPVLVGGAHMPNAEELGADLKPLARRNALTLSDQEFQRDADILVETLQQSPRLGKGSLDFSGDPKLALRKKLLRRLIWKVPLIFLLMSFAVWWQMRNEPGTENPKAASFTGVWEGEVTYPWGTKYKEEFFFQPEGDRLYGTASFLGAKHGIEDGKIKGDEISFFVTFEELSDGQTRQHKNYYGGRLAARDVSMRLQDDRGNPPVEFVLRKLDAAR